MKKKLLVTAATLAISTLASAARVDVTDHPDKAFFVGYDRVYKRFEDGSVCSAMYAQLRSGHEQIGTNQLCEGLGITEKQIYDDLVGAMNYVKEHSSAEGFSEYFRMTGHRFFSDEPRDFCVFRNAVAYVFTSTRSQSDPDWKYISSMHLRPGAGSSVYGLWKSTPDGRVIAKTGLNQLQPETITIDMKDASDCRSTKPYVPGLLLPSD